MSLHGADAAGLIVEFTAEALLSSSSEVAPCCQHNNVSTLLTWLYQALRASLSVLQRKGAHATRSCGYNHVALHSHYDVIERCFVFEYLEAFVLTCF